MTRQWRRSLPGWRAVVTPMSMTQARLMKKMKTIIKSEFSMASMRSDLSFVSGVSSVLSELSGLSSHSTSSRASQAGSATVSVLSEMKIDKKGGSSVKGGDNSTHSFAIKVSNTLCSAAAQAFMTTPVARGLGWRRRRP